LIESDCLRAMALGKSRWLMLGLRQAIEVQILKKKTQVKMKVYRHRSVQSIRTYKKSVKKRFNKT
jgi:hypothetical protein